MDHVGELRRRTRTEYLYLALAVGGATAAVLLFMIDHTPTAAVDMPDGIYGLLVGVCVVGAVGWIVRSGDAQRRRELIAARVELEEAHAELVRGQAETHALLADVRASLTELAEILAARPARTGHAASGGRTYASYPVGIARPAVDADTAAAVQRIQLKLLRGGN